MRGNQMTTPEKISKVKEAKKTILLKSLAEKKASESRVTFSISIERRVKDVLDICSNDYGISTSFLINEILKHDLLVDG